MGQAKNRGSYEQRKASAIKTNAHALEVEKIENIRLKKEEAFQYAMLTPEQRLQEKRKADALMGYMSIPLGVLGDYKIRI